MKIAATAVAFLLLTSPTFAADPVNTNGFITAMGNQLNQRLDQYQAAHPEFPASFQGTINSFQSQNIGPAINFIKSVNPLPNAVSPIQPFTIPPIH